MTQFVKWINIILVLLTLLSYLSPYLNPSYFWFISLLGLVYPILLLLNLAFLVYWGIKWERYFFFSFCCILLGFPFLSKNFGFNNTATSLVDSIKVFTFNMNSGHIFRAKQKNNKEAVPFENYVEMQNAEIICLQEFLRSADFEKIKTADQKKFHFAYSDSKRLATISAYPIKNYGSFGFLNTTNGILYADLDVNGKMIRVYNVHLKSNQITTIIDQVAKEKDFRERETWHKVKDIFKGYRNMSKVRAAQALELAEHISQSPYPIIICGDFNDVPQSYTYQVLAKGRSDHFQEKGYGIGSTFIGNVPFLRIDYILSSPSLKAVGSKIIKDDYSDHYPVVSYIEIE